MNEDPLGTKETIALVILLCVLGTLLNLDIIK